MSRIGKQPIAIDDRIKVNVDDNCVVTVSGPKGALTYKLPEMIGLRQEEKTLVLENNGDEGSKNVKALYGTARSIVQNMVVGVTDGFRKELQLQGVGYRGKCDGSRLILSLGYSHPVEFCAPEGVDISMPENTRIVVEGIDKQLVGQAAATIRGFRPPDSYKGKGVRYLGEHVPLKEGKTIG